MRRTLPDHLDGSYRRQPRTVICGRWFERSPFWARNCSGPRSCTTSFGSFLSCLTIHTGPLSDLVTNGLTARAVAMRARLLHLLASKSACEQAWASPIEFDGSALGSRTRTRAMPDWSSGWVMTVVSGGRAPAPVLPLAPTAMRNLGVNPSALQSCSTNLACVVTLPPPTPSNTPLERRPPQLVGLRMNPSRVIVTVVSRGETGTPSSNCGRSAIAFSPPLERSTSRSGTITLPRSIGPILASMRTDSPAGSPSSRGAVRNTSPGTVTGAGPEPTCAVASPIRLEAAQAPLAASASEHCVSPLSARSPISPLVRRNVTRAMRRSRSPRPKSSLNVVLPPDLRLVGVVVNQGLSAAAHGAPAPLNEVVKDALGVAFGGVGSVSRAYGVRPAVAVCVPQLCGVTSTERSPPWNVSWNELNGSWGRFWKVVVTWPLLPFRVTCPTSFRRAPGSGTSTKRRLNAVDVLGPK